MKLTESKTTQTLFTARQDGHKLYILIEETADQFNYYLRVDNYGDYHFMFGSPKKNHYYGEDITETKESFIEIVKANIEGRVQYGVESYLTDMEIFEQGLDAWYADQFPLEADERERDI